MSRPSPSLTPQSAQRLADAVFVAVPVVMTLFMAIALTVG
jgi:hypothetical protein